MSDREAKGGAMILVTDRDMAMIEWLGLVRMASMDTLRYALAGLSGAGEPVSLRRAQQWVSRMREVELVDRSRPVLRDGSVVWATPLAIGRPAPKLLRQTMRHEMAVSAAAARYLFNGFTWRRDRIAAHLTDHQADGVAMKDGRTHLVEIELTPKALGRYRIICASHSNRLEAGEITDVIYLSTIDAARAVTRQADKLIFRTIRPQLRSLVAFDARGAWVGGNGIGELFASLPSAEIRA
jgi:hypothetical protein